MLSRRASSWRAPCAPSSITRTMMRASCAGQTCTRTTAVPCPPLPQSMRPQSASARRSSPRSCSISDCGAQAARAVQMPQTRAADAAANEAEAGVIATVKGANGLNDPIGPTTEGRAVRLSPATARLRQTGRLLRSSRPRAIAPVIMRTDAAPAAAVEGAVAADGAIVHHVVTPTQPTIL